MARNEVVETISERRYRGDDVLMPAARKELDDLKSARSTNSYAPGGSSGASEAPAAKKRVVVAISAEPTTLSDTLNAPTPGSSAGAPELELLVHGRLSVVGDHGQRVPRFAYDPTRVTA